MFDGASLDERILEAALDSLHEGVMLLDKAGRIMLVNEAAATMVGAHETGVLRRHIGGVIPDSRLVAALGDTGTQVQANIVIKGRIYTVSAAPVRHDSGIWGTLAIFREAPPQRSAPEAVAKSSKIVKQLDETRRELELIIESSNDGLYITDGEGRTLRVNKTFEEIAGIRADEIVGHHMRDLVDEGFLSESVTLEILSMKEPRPVTKIYSLRNGKYVISTGRPVFDERGQIHRVVTNVRDITYFRDFENRLEETRSALEKSRAEAARLRSEFLMAEDAVARSKMMFHVLDMVKQVAPYPTTVLVTGESGVGKEVVAKLLHLHSGRQDGPFIKVNCGAIPETLIESELFGYEPGAFTGAARKGKPGMLELADNGTLFLDEIGELALDMQVKLLQVIQDQTVMRLGGLSSRALSVRFVAASNRDLIDMVGHKLFREDLYYRLNVVKINVPPLRERKSDIPALALHFLKMYCTQYKISKKISPQAMEIMAAYTWPGNVRELRNAVENLVIMAAGPVITPEHLPQEIHSHAPRKHRSVSVAGLVPLRDAVTQVETQLIARAVQECGSIRKAAKALDVAHSTLLRKMRMLGLANRMVE